MSSMTGNQLKLSVFGQSHSPCIGVVIDGFPAAFRPDENRIASFMARRAPGGSAFSTARKEADAPKIISGLVDGMTCGAPITAIIENTNVRSGDYANIRDVPRPGHADLTAWIKYRGVHDVRGGGHFSGRLTAPLCFAGALAAQYLETRGVSLRTHIYAIDSIKDVPYDMNDDDLPLAPDLTFPVLDEAAGYAMREAIGKARADGDSVGGVVECAVLGLPSGLGDPMFDGVENVFAKNLFAIPAVKGVEFGEGFAAAAMRGSAHNDALRVRNGTITSATNHAGGILGGITTGRPVIFRAAFKPTPSIAQLQKSVSLSRRQDADLQIVGRHDPCVVPRAAAAVEAVAAFTALDLILTGGV